MVANETTVFNARSQLMPGKPWGFSGRLPWPTRIAKAKAICAMFTRRAAKKYCFQPMVTVVSAPISL